MKSKIFKQSVLAFVVMLAINTMGFAQEVPEPPAPELPPAPQLAPLQGMSKADSKAFQLKMKQLNVKMKVLQKQMLSINMQHQMQMKLHMKSLDKQFKHLDKDLNFRLDSLKNFNFTLNDSVKDYVYNFSTNIVPQIALGFKDFDTDFSYSYNNADANFNNQNGDDGIEKVKTYSKIYPVDANDVIILDNRFGKITVNTWTQNE